MVKKSLTSHPKGVKVFLRKSKGKKMTQKQESGRSLTEMMGVLAVIGIITVVGIRLFNSAMDRHRANELIYEANKRATTVAMQITAGHENLYVSEHTDPPGYTFGAEFSASNPSQFKITIDGVSWDVCQQMKNQVGPGTPIRHMNETCTEITFNNDLSVMTQQDCLSQNKIWCANTGWCSDTANCCIEGDCAAGSCPSGSSTNGAKAGGKTGIFVNGTECVCDVQTQAYMGGEACVTRPTECHSWTTNECGFGYYCNFSYDASVNKVNGSDSCYANLSGTCTKITNVQKLSDSHWAILREAGFKNPFVRGPGLNWWSANSWCIGLGKRTIGIDEMDCYDQGTRLITKDTAGGYCCKSGMLCLQNSWNAS